MRAQVAHDGEATVRVKAQTRLLHQRSKHGGRQVVDAIEAGILQGMQRLGAASTRHSRDYDNLWSGHAATFRLRNAYK